jgi:mannose-6-phosphate isomerase-like protein (cupin superfamily)
MANNIINKKWGYELIIVNCDFCGKILHFNKNSKSSMHYHLKKNESWYVNNGNFIFRWIDTVNADILEKNIKQGDIIHIPIGMPHQLETIDGGEIFEISNTHYDDDSYRIIKN